QLGPALRVAARIGWLALVEGVQELGQQWLQNLIAREVHTPDQRLTEGLIPAGGLGAGVGAIAETLATPFRRRGGGPPSAKGAKPAPEAAPTLEDIEERLDRTEAPAPPPTAPETQPPPAPTATAAEPGPEIATTEEPTQARPEAITPERVLEARAEEQAAQPEFRGTTIREPEAAPTAPGRPAERGEPFERPQAPVEPEAAPVAPEPTPALIEGVPSTVYRGYGRTDKGAVYAGPAEPILGPGRYYAFTPEAAKEFGPETEQIEFAPKNPLVIRSDEEWRALIKEAGWKFPNPFGQELTLVNQDISRLQEIIRARGYDAVVTWDDTTQTDTDRFGNVIKNLRNVFGQPQAFQFGLEAAPVPAEEPAAEAEPEPDLSNWVAARLQSGETIDAKGLFEAAAGYFGGTAGEGKFDPRDAYDALEAGVNMHLSRTRAHIPKGAVDKAQADVAALREMSRALPTQSRRTTETTAFQQFSTPPEYAYLAAWVANIGSKDSVLEPSAGTGTLASFARLAGAERVVVNELAERRADVLRAQRFDKVYVEDAAQLNNILPKGEIPTVVVMNPPFSATAGRTSTKDTSTGATHVKQALLRLADGGRLVAILGRGMKPGAAIYQRFLSDLGANYRHAGGTTVQANLGIPGKVYQKHGTSFETRLLVIDKVPAPAGHEPLISGVGSLESAIETLEEVRDGRIPATERAPAEPEGPEVAPEGEGAAEPGVAVPGPTPDRGPERGPVGPPGGAVARPEPEARDEGPEPGPGRPEGGVPVPGEPPDRRGDGTGPGRLGPVDTRAEAAQAEFTEGLYAAYRPVHVEIKGAKPHPDIIMETAAMAAVDPPLPTYQFDLPKGIITQGKLSDIQLEAVVYAGQAHAKMLPAVEDETAMRRGFFLGDGTGVGKGRVVAAIILDNWRQGRKRAVWFTKNDTELFSAARRDLDAVGAGKVPAFLFPQAKKAMIGDGVLVASYAKLSREDRRKQLEAWLGKDFDGVFVFDEAHKMGNAIETKGARGKSKPSKVALAGIEVQQTFPNARVVYASATGATEIKNLAYAERLGLWGRGTAFNDKRDFIEEMNAGGVAALEVVARDLKSYGLYLSRNLSYDGVKYRRLVHDLSPAQTALYDDMAEAWQGVLKDVEAALGDTGGGGPAKAAALSAFWGANQRFFNQVLNSLQMPSVIDAMEKDIAAGHSPVLQLVNTNEAAQERALDTREEGQALEDIDLTPFEMLVGFVEKSFPVRQWEDYTDEDGNLRQRPVVDSEGNPVLNAEAVKKRDALVAKLRTMKNAVPLGPLDLVVQHFGHENVAELTGRGRRIVFKGGERILQKLGKTFRSKELRAFWDDKKQIVIFSDAAGTGIDLHAGKDFKNQRLRMHYLIQAGWRADNAVQGFGRSHRSYQAQPPEFILASTNVKGQKRFITTIARRLGNLGALTKGEAKAGSGEMFRPEDNLEGPLARAAFYNLIVDMDAGKIESWTLDRFEAATGLKLRTAEGAVVRTVPEISRFLNRVLSLTVNEQNEIFDEFETRLAQQSEIARQKGELDVGVEVYRADRIIEEERRLVRTDEETGATTTYIKLREFNKTKPRTWAGLQKGFGIEGYARNKRSKRIWAVTAGFEETGADGNRVVWKRLVGVNSSQLVESSRIRRDTYDRVDAKEAQEAWDAEVEATPEFRDKPLHMITGALLPVWDRVPSTGTINRLKTETGAQHLGRVVSGKNIRSTLKNLGAFEKPTLTPAQAVDAILKKDDRLELSNAWTLKRSLQGGEHRIEIVGPRYGDTRTLQGEGVLVETVAYRDRFFIPNAKVMATVTEFREIVGILGEETEEDPDITE
ncbi:hypothetical protein LCGC14_1226750, partial [marine sediment metagenome]